MVSLIRRKDPGQAWETEVDTGGGGSQPGTPLVRGPFVVNFDDAGLENGIEFYTPTEGDLLMDIRLVVDVAFDGTTPRGDVGIGVGGGLFNYGLGIPSLAVAGNMGDGIVIDDGLANLVNDLSNSGNSTAALSPFLSSDPMKFWASQDGLAGGLAVGGTAGVLRVYIVTATPVAFA